MSPTMLTADDQDLELDAPRAAFGSALDEFVSRDDGWLPGSDHDDDSADDFDDDDLDDDDDDFDDDLDDDDLDDDDLDDDLDDDIEDDLFDDDGEFE